MLSNWYVQPAWLFYPPKFPPETRSWDFVPDKKGQRPISVTSAEQTIMICEAILVQDTVYLELLSAPPARDPAEAKRLGRTISKFDEILWVRHRADIAMYVITEKFCSDAPLAVCLDATSDATLNEFSQRDKEMSHLSQFSQRKLRPNTSKLYKCIPFYFIRPFPHWCICTIRCFS